MQLPDLSEIKKLRRKLNLNQTQLAQKSNVSQSLIARVEAGTVDPRYSKIKSIFKALSEYEAREVTAADIMTAKVLGVQKSDTLRKASEAMEKNGLSQVPVYDGDQIVGSLTEQLISEKIAQGMSAGMLSKMKVAESMGDVFPMVSSETPLSLLSSLLEYNTAVIVSDRGKMTGIITRSDLLKVVRS